MTGLARGFATVRLATPVPVRDWQWASQWCKARLQFRLQAYAARLAKGLATVRHGAIRDCIFRLHALCFGFGKGLRYGANRDCSSGRKRGVATVPRATTVPVSGLCNGLGKGGGHDATRDYSSSFRPLETGLARGFATVPTVTAVPVAVVCNGPGKGLGHGATRDYSSGVRLL